METIEWMTCFSVFSVLVCLQPLEYFTDAHSFHKTCDWRWGRKI